MNCADIGSMSVYDANKMKSQGRSLQAGDVLIYIANDYGVTLGRICDELKNRGVIVLPVYVGKYASLSQLSHLAETQFTGKLNKYIYYITSSNLIFNSQVSSRFCMTP